MKITAINLIKTEFDWFVNVGTDLVSNPKQKKLMEKKMDYLKKWITKTDEQLAKLEPPRSQV